jgi:hypothetical protein
MTNGTLKHREMKVAAYPDHAFLALREGRKVGRR